MAEEAGVLEMTPDRIKQIMIECRHEDRVIRLLKNPPGENKEEWIPFAANKIIEEISREEVDIADCIRSSCGVPIDVALAVQEKVKGGYQYGYAKAKEELEEEIEDKEQFKIKWRNLGAFNIVGEIDFPKEFTEDSLGNEQTEEAIHYLKVLQENYSVFQHEIRDAIDYAIKYLSQPKRHLGLQSNHLSECGDAGELKTDDGSLRRSNNPKHASPKGDLFDDEFKEWFDNEIERKKALFRKGICPTCGGDYPEYKSQSILTDEQVTSPHSYVAVETVSTECLETSAKIDAGNVTAPRNGCKEYCIHSEESECIDCDCECHDHVSCVLGCYTKPGVQCGCKCHKKDGGSV